MILGYKTNHWFSESDSKDMLALKPLIRVMKRHDLIKGRPTKKIDLGISSINVEGVHTFPKLLWSGLVERQKVDWSECHI